MRRGPNLVSIFCMLSAETSNDNSSSYGRARRGVNVRKVDLGSRLTLGRPPRASRLGPTHCPSVVVSGHCTKSRCNRLPSVRDPALYTGGPVWAGVCTLVVAGTVQTPFQTTLPVRKVPVVVSEHCANPLQNNPPSAQSPGRRLRALRKPPSKQPSQCAKSGRTKR